MWTSNITFSNQKDPSVIIQSDRSIEIMMKNGIINKILAKDQKPLSLLIQLYSKYFISKAPSAGAQDATFDPFKKRKYTRKFTKYQCRYL